ncbi:hypothetical protein [Desulfoferula mesophila]|uniref:Uncharacterized protein n=1 Tax=Desulfoferula mesophila TaxID=3058419 RepID=A0AAU9EME8_9BACT|nr:hypothetical protein FAK_41410 [Desulfoferula mesophilus]
MPPAPMPSGPPWSGPGQWAQANQALDALSRLPACAPARSLAHEFAAARLALAPFMERLCAATCPRCLDPCCVRARLWWGFADLAFLHLAGLPLPLKQISYAPGGACPHLGPHGCRLARPLRPWVCDWHLCPAQKARLGGWQEAERRELSQELERARALRKKMVEALVEGAG